MDEQLTFARGLQAAGYTLGQIRDVLLEHGVDLRTVYMVLDSIETTPTATSAPAQAAAGPITNSAAYVNYVKTMLERSTPWADINAALASWGVAASDRSTIYNAVAAEASSASDAMPLGGPLYPAPQNE